MDELVLCCKRRQSAFKFVAIKMCIGAQEDLHKKRKTQPLVLQILVFQQCP